MERVASDDLDDDQGAVERERRADGSIDERTLDALVPAPPPRWKRVLVWAVVGLVLGGAAWSAASGRTVPEADVFLASSGGVGPVHVTLEVTNASSAAIELVGGPDAPPGLVEVGSRVDRTEPALGAVGAERDADPFPIRLGVGDRAWVTTWFEVDDCEALSSGAAPTVGVVVRVASAPWSLLRIARTTTWDALPPDVPWSDGFGPSICPAT